MTEPDRSPQRDRREEQIAAARLELQIARTPAQRAAALRRIAELTAGRAQR